MAANSKSEERVSDLHKSGRIHTVVETNTQVVDNTEEAAEAAAVEYHEEAMEITPGTILVTYGDVKTAEVSEDA